MADTTPTRRRFFGLAAAPVVVAAAPVVAAPMVEMVAADIAPVVPPLRAGMTPRDTWRWACEDVEISVAEWAESYIRPQMLRLAREIDADIRKALYG